MIDLQTGEMLRSQLGGSALAILIEVTFQRGRDTGRKTGGVEERKTGRVEEKMTGGVEEKMTGGVEEKMTGGVEDRRTDTITRSAKNIRHDIGATAISVKL